ncbi:MAG: hypothetical protein IJX67_05220, partial [Oscillospiraceae bacterium]|nr:hypothetical protein [Oscillospiraceae bacterium]
NRHAKVAKEAKVSFTLRFLILWNCQRALSVDYQRQCSFYRRRLFAAYTRSTGFLNQIVTRIKSDTPSDNK